MGLIVCNRQVELLSTAVLGRDKAYMAAAGCMSALAAAVTLGYVTPDTLDLDWGAAAAQLGDALSACRDLVAPSAQVNRYLSQYFIILLSK